MGLLSSTSLLMCIAIFGLACAEVKLCVTSQQEITKCNTFSNIACVLGTDSINCVNKINNNEADVTVLDGGDIYLAGKCHSMKPILSENTGATPPGVGYYAVAVAKKSSHVTIQTLEGTKSCHTGVNKTSDLSAAAGEKLDDWPIWWTPKPYLVSTGLGRAFQASNNMGSNFISMVYSYL
ncbi:MFI2 [Acanthosepion pharaonis]|uniref:MFI2 n=1 Tax=Acanthosepion pharaonis TaxID=158019 RepID=A0A812E562_ACAPH|nr:MFI2 [Sepia pharaonis]